MSIAAFTVKAQGILKAIQTEAGLSPTDFARKTGEIPPPKSGTLRAV